MTLYFFNQMDEQEQLEAIWAYGVKIGERVDGEFTFELFQIDSFYVERSYHTEHKFFRTLRSFTSTIPLDPYIQQFNIKDML
ncbi:MAG: hypothetical protein ABIN01_20080 [Ferruginibacter sp.]